MGNKNMNSLFKELTDYEKEGIYLSIEDVPASPMQIVEAHMMREDAVYMRDYVLDEKGDIKELCFHNVQPDDKQIIVNTPQINTKMSK